MTKRDELLGSVVVTTDYLAQWGYVISDKWAAALDEMIFAGKFNPYHEPAGSSIGGQFASGAGGGGVITDKDKIIEAMADAYEKKYGFDKEHPREKYIERLKKHLSEASSEFVSKVEKGVGEAVNKYGVERVNVIARGQRTDANDRWVHAQFDEQGYIVFIEQEEEDVLSSVGRIGAAPSQISSTFPNKYAGVYVHEVGHYEAFKNPDIYSRASAVDLDNKEIRTWVKENISYYASTDDRELAAEVFAISKHPDYSKLPDKTKEFVERILQ